MFDIVSLIIFLSLLLGGIFLCRHAAKKGEGAYGVLYVALFVFSLYLAYLFKRGNTAQATNAFIPFYKLFALREYGYASILRDLLAFGAPFLLAGFFIMPAFVRAGLTAAFATGLLAALAMNIFPLYNGMSFVSDEYIYAGLGCATGGSIYVLLAHFFKKRPFFEKLRLPIPRRRRVRAAGVVFAAMYFLIALVMVFDYGERYAPIQFFDSDTPLPETLTLDCELNADAARANIYIPDTSSSADKAEKIAQELGIEGGTVYQDGIYLAQDEVAKLTFTDGGSWVYELLEEPTGEPPTQESAQESVNAFFAQRELMSVGLGEVDDVVAHSGADGTTDGYDLYLSSAISGMPIIGSSTLVVSVRAQNTVTKIRRYDGDVLASTIVNIISQQKAYDKIRAGDCAYTLFAPAVSASIQSCQIVYMANSSQGYYLPVWMFTCLAQYEDGTTGTFEIYVEAKK